MTGIHEFVDGDGREEMDTILQRLALAAGCVETTERRLSSKPAEMTSENEGRQIIQAGSRNPG